MVSLAMVLSVGLIAFLIGCGQSNSTPTSTETINGAVLSSGNRVVTYGGVRAATTQDIKASGTNTVTGYVYDSFDGSPIVSVEVWAGTTIVATTDSTGAYSLSGVPGGDVTFTAIPPVVTGYGGIGTSVTTNATKINFHIYYGQTQTYATIEGSVVDSNGDTVDSATIKVQCRLNNQSAFYYSLGGSLSDASGNFTMGAYTGKVIVAAGKTGVGNGCSTEESLSAGETLSVNIAIPAQGTVSGTFSVPSGFSSWQMTSSPVLAYIGANYGVQLPSFTYEASSPSFNISVPASTNLFVNCQINADDYCKQSGVFEKDVSVASGGTTSKDYTLYDVPSNATVTTTETYTVISWEAPSTWSPDYYMIIALIETVPSSRYDTMIAFTDKTTLTIPKPIYQSDSTNIPMVYALESTAAVDFSSMDINNIEIGHFAGIKAE